MTAGPVGSSTPPRPCPICGKPAEARYRPFCSKRCADVDLGRWLGERYRISSAPSDEGEGEEEDDDETPSATEPDHRPDS